MVIVNPIIEIYEQQAMSHTEQDIEGILSDSLEFLGGKPVVDDSVIHYGPLVLTLAPKVCLLLSSYLLIHSHYISLSGRQSASSTLIS